MVEDQESAELRVIEEREEAKRDAAAEAREHLEDARREAGKCILDDCGDDAAEDADYCEEHYPHDNCEPSDGAPRCRINDESCMDRQREHAAEQVQASYDMW